MGICKKDVRKAILGKINTEFITNRPTFQRMSDDTVAITNQGKTQNRQQAYEIANNLISRAKALFNNGVSGYISEPSNYDPLTVTFTVSDVLIDKYLAEAPPTLFQKEGVEQSKASPKTIQNIKEWLQRSGIDLQTLDTQRFGNINGVALTLQKIIQVAEGKEDVALTEEAMHMLTQMIKVGDKSLFSRMMNKITIYKMFQETRDLYQTDPSYMNEDGSVNIPKIKEEAIGKVLSEYYINNLEENGDLLAQTKSWVDQIIDWIKKLLHINNNPFTMSIAQMDKISPSTINEDTLQSLALRIQEKVKGFTQEGVNQMINDGDYLSVVTAIGEQLSDPETYDDTTALLSGDSQLAEDVLSTLGEFQQIPSSDFFKKLDEKIVQFNLEKVEIENNKEDESSDNYYKVTVNGVPHITDRTTDFAKRENKKKGAKDITLENPEKQKYWKKMAMSGTSGHYDLENIVKQSLNPDGTLKIKEDITLTLKASTNSGIYRNFVKYLLGTPKDEGFLYQFPEGSKFRVEQRIYNNTIQPTVDGEKKYGRAGTIDLLVELPNGDIKIYDWKFMGFLLGKPDQNFLKRSQHALQLSDYKNTLKTAYGIKNVEAFTIPIHAQYTDVIDENTKEKIPYLTSITMGKTNFKEEERTPLLPVIPDDQSTGNADVDALVRKLRSRYNRLYKKKVGEDEWDLKIDQLNELSNSIRNLQVALNFAPLSVQAQNFQENIKKIINKYKDIDFSKYTAVDRKSAINELLDFEKSSEYYSSLDEVFISQYGSENLSEKNQNILDSLRKSSAIAKEEAKKLISLLDGLALVVAKEKGFEGYLDATTEMPGTINSLTEGLSVNYKALQLITTMNIEQSSANNILINKEIDKFEKLYIRLLSLAKSKGTSPFSLIAKKGKHELVYKTNPKFYEDKNKALKDKNKKWIKENINLEKYNELSSTLISKKIAEVDERIYNSDPKKDAFKKKEAKLAIKNSFDLKSINFNGWENSTFNYLLSQTLKIEEHPSEEYQELKKEGNEAALDMYNYIVEFNRHLKSIGYLPKEATISFLPFIKATTLQRLANSKDKISTIKNILYDSVNVNVNESQSYGKIDEETGEQDRSIPTFFTIDQGENSQDLPKIMNTMIKAAYEYEGAKNLEDVFQLIHKVEQNKGHLETKNGRVIFEGDKPRIFSGNEKNADIIEKNINDYLYGISQESNTAFDALIKSRSKGTEEERENKAFQAKKAILQGNMLTQQLAVGLKLLVAIPNFVGGNMQSLVNSGTFYKGTEYFNSERQIVSSLGGNNIMKALINMIVPLNDNLAKEKTRHMAWKQGLFKWMGTWSFNDVMMSSNALPDKLLQLSNAASWLKNTMLDEQGDLVNIRQYVFKKNLGRYGLSFTERKEIERNSEKEIESLKKDKSLPKIAKIINDELVIEGMNEASLPAYRAKIVEYGRNITGQMSSENRADYQRNIIARSFMMFKNWIPKQVSIRALDIHKNPILDEWEYGRTRLFFKTLNHLRAKSVTKLGHIVKGTDEGLKIMREILEDKQKEYYQKTGQQLLITEEEFFDLMRKEIKNELKELSLLIGILGLVIAAKLAAPDDDDDDLRKNRYKFWARAINKVSDELYFYWNPLSMESITRGTVLPSLGLLTKATNVFQHSLTEITGLNLSDLNESSDDVREKNKLLKYVFNMVPIASQFQTELLPIISPETAKDLGIKITTEARAY